MEILRDYSSRYPELMIMITGVMKGESSHETALLARNLGLELQDQDITEQPGFVVIRRLAS